MFTTFLPLALSVAVVSLRARVAAHFVFFRWRCLLAKGKTAKPATQATIIHFFQQPTQIQAFEELGKIYCFVMLVVHQLHE